MLVSIVVTSYNYAGFIGRCISSCLAQELIPDAIETIVVDDCSSDNTAAILKDFVGAPNFRCCSSPRNVGVAEAANIGIRMATGQFVTRVDADDYVAPDFAAKLSSYLLTHADAFCVSCDYHHVDEQGARLRTRSARTYPISCGIMYRKAEWLEAGLYSGGWRCREEEELRCRLSDRYAIHHLDEALYFYVLHGNNKTMRAEQMDIYRQRLISLYNLPDRRRSR